MLPAQHRLRASADFTAVVRGRGGVREGSRLLVVHANTPPERRSRPVRVGFVVPKAVGGAVIRNRTKRRLRAVCAARLADLPAGLDLVVRVNPGAGAATSADLAEAVDRSTAAVLRRLSRREDGS